MRTWRRGVGLAASASAAAAAVLPATLTVASDPQLSRAAAEGYDGVGYVHHCSFEALNMLVQRRVGTPHEMPETLWRDQSASATHVFAEALYALRASVSVLDRIKRLERRDRAVLMCASVIGQRFDLAILARLRW